MNMRKLFGFCLASILAWSTTSSLFIVHISADSMHPIVLPFFTGWEEISHPLGRVDSVDFKKDFQSYPNESLPRLGYLDSGDKNVSVPASGTYHGYYFGTRYLRAAGYFGSNESYCYFNLFDMTPTSDYGPPFKIKPQTFINIFYYHYQLGNCMIDAQIYNNRTKQYWTLRDFYNDTYVVDQNGVRINPACRYNDTIGSWQFACFDLSCVYKSDPENWFVTKIWIGFDNRVNHAIGPARTYFDNLHITYGVADKQIHVEDGDDACTAVSVIAWAFYEPPEGKYLELKVGISCFDDGIHTIKTIDYLVRPSRFSVNVDVANAQIIVGENIKPTGANLTNLTTSKTGEWVVDVLMTAGGIAVTGIAGGDLLLGVVTPAGLIWMGARLLSMLFLLIYEDNIYPPTFEWPEVDWGDLNDNPPTSAMGEVFVKVPVQDGFNSIPISFTSEYCCQYRQEPANGQGESVTWLRMFHNSIDVSLNLEWNSEHDSVNLPPETPSTPSGPSYGYTYTTYTYSTSTTDPNGDNVQYEFSWGDGTSNTITGWYASGTNAGASHYWTSTGTYYVKVRAQDSNNAWSDWSPNLTVSISSGGGCPFLYVYNGSEYICEGLLNIHNPEGIDIVTNHTLVSIPQRVGCVYLLRLVEHPQTHSYIDQVKLYAILEDGRTIRLPLIWAWHSETRIVLPQLLFSDNWKTDTLGADFNNGISQSIDLKFLALPQNLSAIGFIFQIEGNNLILKY